MQIIEAIRRTFKISKAFELMDLKADPRAASMVGFTQLLILLNDKTTIPKILADALELVVVQIKNKDEKTRIESEFLKQISELIDAPLYGLKNH